MNILNRTGSEVLSAYLKEIDSRLDELIPEQNSAMHAQLFSATRYALLGPGKRMRPSLVLLTTETLGGSLKDALDPACALEMVHAYSLVHDDLPCMDNDDFRRGRPTVHKAFDEATAMLAGDLLLTEAFQVLTSAEGLNADQKLEMISLLARMSGGSGMIGGQMMDLLAEGKQLDERHILQIYKFKTSCLIATAFVFGGIIAKVDKPSLEALHSFGINFGLAFQLIDDILDVTDSQKHKGRTESSDVANEKSTLINSLGVEGARQLAENLLNAGVDMLKVIPCDMQPIIDLTSSLIRR